MTAAHTTVEELRAVASKVGVMVDHVRPQGRRIAFVLRLLPERKYQRVGNAGRKVAAVCWHGHRDFFRALFALNSAAEIRSHWVGGDIHYTAENFERTYQDTGHANIGSMYQPLAYRDACECEE